jgi:UDP-arabinose 4-epimerase
MNILVTGGAGYIGSHTAKALHAAGFNPVTLDNLSAGHEWAVRWGPLVRGQIQNGALIRRVVKEHGIRAAIHFAANAYVGESVVNPRKYFHNNVVNTLKLMDALLEADVKTVVFSSTCATYGNPESPLISECHTQRPVNPYGESKLFVERLLHAYGQAYGLRWMALRYFNAAGADPGGQIGEDHDPETHLIPLVLEAALGRRPPVQIYGTDYNTPDGTAIRDYIHVSDLAQAHVLALDRLLSGMPPVAVNLGTGIGYSVRQVIAAAERISGCAVPTREAPRRAGDPAVLVADPALAAELLGWRAAYRDVEAVLATAWRWHASRAGMGGRYLTAST